MIAQRKKLIIFKLIAAAFVLLLSLPLNAPIAQAHQNGCHRWHSCPSDTGSYVCGDLGYTSGCGTVASTPAPTPKPRVPVVTTKTATIDEPVPAPSPQIEINNNEYTGYNRELKAAKPGLVKKQYTVTYTDNVETGRVLAAQTTVDEAQPQLIQRGGRPQPAASITSLSKSPKRWFNFGGSSDTYDVKGTAPNGTKLVLLDGAKKIASTTVANGKFTFERAAVHDNDKLTIAKKTGWFSHLVISETTKISHKLSTITTDYEQLHGLAGKSFVKSTPIPAPSSKPAPSPTPTPPATPKPAVRTLAPTPTPATPAASSCDPNYSGACVPIASDVDCAGGTGNGPAYVQGPVKIIGTDIYKLDSDHDGYGCE